jgi:hypothetical protein
MYSHDKTRDDYGGYAIQSTEYALSLLGKVASHVPTIPTYLVIAMAATVRQDEAKLI